MVTRQRRITKPALPEVKGTIPAVVLQPGWVILVGDSVETVVKRTRIDEGPRWEIQTDVAVHQWGAAKQIGVISTERTSNTGAT